MSGITLKQDIKEALARIPEGDFGEGAVGLLGCLGYRSERTLPGQSGGVGDFLATYPPLHRREGVDSVTKSERMLVESVESVRVLFQLTGDELDGLGLGDEGQDGSGIHSFVFVAVELKQGGQNSFSRGRYAEIVQDINRRFAMPVVVLFKTAGHFLTLAFVHRRPHKRKSERDVMGRISLVREINASNPHSAHLSILADLSLESRRNWIRQQGKDQNFNSLLDAWLDALDTEELNRKFYRELFGWFQRAVDEARLPEGVVKAEEQVIRFITRILFVWFIKEKGLVAEDLFKEPQVRKYLKDYDSVTGDSYYRAVLQNLFFATLNTEIKKRGFSREDRTTHRNFSYFRFRDEITDSEGLLRLFNHSPFINGGLFECLDSFENYGAGGSRLDFFTDNVKDPSKREHQKLSWPNRLFFDDKGLFPLFERYKFTIEENTPVEKEVALDPELMGKAFENLLAAYNPETRETARKQTGSYYTPTPVVEYMVDEVLGEALSGMAKPATDDDDWWRERLRYLLDYEDDYDDAEELFEESEKDDLIGAISEIKVIDPAVGSGAFPMGILHKLTLALRRLDPENERWQKIQKDQALHKIDKTLDKDSTTERRSELAEIDDTFQLYRDSDYGRKLYLIQNSIFGVDIQPIACQIAKLRFFISLAIEQNSTDHREDNYGIKPLPNLETRFVAADTLIGLERSSQGELQTSMVWQLEQEVVDNRERYFHANTRDQKWEYRKKDEGLRVQLADALKESGFPAESSEKIATWDPYDQNTSVQWFDAEYMFGIRDGFDIVIGNPPYRQVKKGIYSAHQFPYSEGKDSGKQNLYKLFVELSYNLCKEKGVATMIVQSSLMCDQSSIFTRKMLLDHTSLKHLIEFPERARTRQAQVFASVTQGTCIYQFTKTATKDLRINISTGNDAHTISNLLFSTIECKTIVKLYPALFCFPLIKPGAVSILNKIAINQSIKPLNNYIVNLVQGDLNLTSHSNQFSSKPSSVRLLRGSNISRYYIDYSAVQEYCNEDFMTEKVQMNRVSSYLFSQEVRSSVASYRLVFALSDKPPYNFLTGHTINKTLLQDNNHNKALLSILNSKFLDWFFRITSTNNHIQGYQLRQLPIPDISRIDCTPLERLVDSIMQAKANNPNSNTGDEEKEIDKIVYDLYGLTEEEIAIVEGGV